MEKIAIKAEVREKRGKGPARRLRAAGKLPGVVYGPGVDATPIALSPRALEAGLRTEKRRNQVFELELGETKHSVMVRDLLVHPVSRALLHVDFYVVSEDRPVHTSVPVVTKGRSRGVQRGGKLRQAIRMIDIVAAPSDIPASVVVDITNLDIGDSVYVESLELPANVKATSAPRQFVLGVEEDKRAAARAEAEAAGNGKK